MGEEKKYFSEGGSQRLRNYSENSEGPYEVCGHKYKARAISTVWLCVFL